MPKLTKTLVDNAQAPAQGDAYIWDTELQGFGVRVWAGGRKAYVIRYRTKGPKRRQGKLTIARCSDMPPEKARELARKEFAKVAEGRDPAAERRSAAPSSAKTVERMFKAYVADLKAKGRASAGEVERALLTGFNNAADALGRDKAAADITATDIVDYVSTFYQAGHRGAANKHRGYIGSAYSWAMKAANDYKVPKAQRIDFGITVNPVLAVAKDNDAMATRDRALSVDEIRKLWKATEPGSTGFWPETAAAIRLMICCGQRVQETLRLDGCEADLDGEALWDMPAHKTKMKKYPHLIPLPPQAIDAIRLLKEMHGDGPLFPARGGAKGELLAHQSVMQAIRRWCAQEGIQPFQTRDLRRTWKSRAKDAGVDRFTRDLIQQHAQSDTGTKHYDRADYLPEKREAMAKWGAWLDMVLNNPQVSVLRAKAA